MKRWFLNEHTHMADRQRRLFCIIRNFGRLERRRENYNFLKGITIIYILIKCLNKRTCDCLVKCL
jgi:hypothetical protein